jgi:hypothetical protein
VADRDNNTIVFLAYFAGWSDPRAERLSSLASARPLFKAGLLNPGTLLRAA